MQIFRLTLGIEPETDFAPTAGALAYRRYHMTRLGRDMVASIK